MNDRTKSPLLSKNMILLIKSKAKAHVYRSRPSASSSSGGLLKMFRNSFNIIAFLQKKIGQNYARIPFKF
jgi:hypothetical protein